MRHFCISATRRLVLALLVCGCTYPALAQSWTITLEELTGIYRRDNEVVSARLSFAAGAARAEALRVIAPTGRVVRSQLAAVETHADGSLKAAELLFPAALIPGERPQYRLLADAQLKLPINDSSIVARRVGSSRFELANERFGVLLNLGLEGTEPALVAAFNKTAGEQRMLNLIDTTPEVKDTPASGKAGAGFGSFLAGQQRAGAFEQVEILEAGPLRARVRLLGARLGAQRETWEFVWLAGSPVLQWRAWLDGGTGANYGFFFNAVSATPNLPFDRWMEGSEAIKFPDGWETDNPPDHLVRTQGARDFDDLPGRHFVFYQRAENYGALGIFETDPTLAWRGIGANQFFAQAPLSANKRTIETALAFPRWKGTETILEARSEYRRFTQPILSVVSRAPSVERGRIAEATPDERLRQSVAARPTAELQREAAAHILDVSLNGAWKLNFTEKSEGEKQGFYRADYDDSGWRAVQVPGSAHTQWLAAAQLYTREAEWVSEKEWWYRRAFRAPAGTQDKRLRLRFEATDYYADVYLNGALLGRHEGYIDPYEFELGDKLKQEGENVIAVRVWTPISYYWRHRPWTIKGSYGAVDQKPDNITPLGITRPVHLLAGGPVVIHEVAVDTRLNRDGSADVVVDLTLDTAQAVTDSELTLTLTPRNFSAPTGLELKALLNLEAGSTTRRFVLHVAQPQLWWTWDHGQPNLYTLAARIAHAGALSDQYACAVGIREIEHVDWKFYLNGKRLFIRGTNSYYHLFLSEMRRSDYERDLRLMRGMNINMIRLHCHFSNPEFYDLADELGILLWQDFLEAAYPEDRDFALKAAALYDPHIRYVRNHPSVALWATSDEESLENYRVLTKHLEPRLYALDPQRRPVVRSTGRYGDGHIYYGWYGGSIWEYAGMNEKFVSELGATALPDYESLIKFLPNHWPIKEHEEEWIFRKLQIPEAMRAWGEPGSLTLQEYIPQTQAYVARLFQLAIERMRRQKYAPAGGILHFHAIDLWPSVTMAALDFYRRPTKAYATVQRSFQLVLPSFAYDRDTWSPPETVKTALWLINDHWYAVPNAQVTWRLVDSAGRVVTSGRAPQAVTLAADSSLKLLDVTFLAPAVGKYTLWATIADERGNVVSENNYEFQVK
ncbi:MAG: beta galactosidase jelly roll domain-containing protein [Acidobacteria bacterium]|nr:beta galactosidase jelly roll domain-containing protein [Acidobacteriota bacterium]MBI3427113.1 beta galactosidase jelly roll domain-containing protein [Acidobacteriota bacterium]